MYDLALVFEGVVRTAEWAPPHWWWAGWFGVAVALAAFRQLSPRYFTHLRWAWSDYRLLLQSRGDFVAPWYSGWLQNSAAGLALSMGLVGLTSRAFGAPGDWSAVLRLLCFWWVVMLLRWCIAHLWEGISKGDIAGREWAMSHRYVLELMAWVVAPWGLSLTLMGPEASLFGVYLILTVWVVLWLLRHRRTFSRIRRLLHRPIEGFFYLCALEILPVAVLIRAWIW